MDEWSWKIAWFFVGIALERVSRKRLLKWGTFSVSRLGLPMSGVGGPCGSTLTDHDRRIGSLIVMRVRSADGNVVPARRAIRREDDIHHGPHPQRAGDVDLSAMGGDDRLTDRQPESAAASLFVSKSCLVTEIEPLEDVGQVLGRDPAPMIANAENGRSIHRGVPDLDRHLPAIFRKLDGVVDQIVDHLAEPSRIPRDQDRPRSEDAELNVPRLGHSLEHLTGPQHDLLD